jgi:hypothetical protein
MRRENKKIVNYGQSPALIKPSPASGIVVIRLSVSR